MKQACVAFMNETRPGWFPRVCFAGREIRFYPDRVLGIVKLTAVNQVRSEGVNFLLRLNLLPERENRG